MLPDARNRHGGDGRRPLSATQPKRRGVPPEVDLDDTRGWWSILRDELRPTPGRLGNALRLLTIALASVAIGEVFRVPEVALLAYFVFIVANNDSGSTVRLALLGGLVLVLATFASILIFMLSLSQPLLRIVLMTCLIFAAGFLTRAATAGPLFFAFGLWTVYQLPDGDQLISSAAQTAYVTGNTTQSSVPDLLVMSPEESLLHSQLWSAFVILVGLAIVLAVNLVWRRDPALVVRNALADRLAAASALCKGVPDAAARLSLLTWQGTTKLLKLNSMTVWLKSDAVPGVDTAALIRAIDRLCLVLLAGSRITAEHHSKTIVQVGKACQEFERQVRGTVPGEPVDLDGLSFAADEQHVTAGLLPLVPLLLESLRSVRAILGGEKPATDDAKSTAASHGILVSDAWSNPDYVHHGLKLTLAAMICYLIERGTNWSGIHTCLVTCFIVALETNGASAHKMVMRIGGCLLGAALGIGTILVLMPLMTDLGDLLLVMTPPLLLAGWVKSGSERSNYVGQQIAIAYYSCVLSGYGPTLNMEGGRDRTIGILLGDIMVFLVFSSIWPVPVAGKVRASVADALVSLGQMVGTAKGRKTTALRKRFDSAIEKSQSLLSDDPYDLASREGRYRRDPSPHRTIDMSLVREIQQLVVPVLVLRSDRLRGQQEQRPGAGDRHNLVSYRDNMEDWFGRAAAYVCNGQEEESISERLPPPPNAGSEQGSDADLPALHASAADAAWCDMLHQDLRHLLDTIASASRKDSISRD